MIKKYLAILSVASFFFAQAQDVSVIKNSADVYSNSASVSDGTAKFNSMAGAMGALGGDISTINTNPAGIGVFITSDLQGTLNIADNKNSSALAGSSYSYKTNHTDLGQVGGVAAFEVNKGTSPWKFVNLGVNFVTRSIEDYTETPANNNITYSVGDDQYFVFDGHAYDRTGSVSKMSIAVGGNYDNKLYVGGGIHIHSANVTQYDTAALTLNSSESGFTPVTSYFYKQYTPYDEDASGFSANIGIIGKVSNEFRLGAAIETPTWWKIDRAYNWYSNSSEYQDGTYSETRHFTSPLKATLSAAYVPSKNLALNVDYSIGVTKPKYSTDDAGSENELNDFYSDYYKSISEVRIGAEYRIQQFRLRAGYAYASKPFDNITMDAFNTDGTSGNKTFDNLYVGERNTIGFGIGYDFRAFYLDAAYQNITSRYANPFLYGSNAAGSEYYSSNNYIYGDSSAVSDVKNTRNVYTITLGWKF